MASIRKILDVIVANVKFAADSNKATVITRDELQKLVSDLMLVYQEFMRAPVQVSDGVPMICHKCGDIDAPEYLLKRSGGKYIALCYKGGEGCWEQSANGPCEFVDHEGVQCTLLAEWEIGGAANGTPRKRVCVAHVAPVLSDSYEHRIYRIDD
jgi:hypothetical protein